MEIFSEINVEKMQRDLNVLKTRFEALNMKFDFAIGELKRRFGVTIPELEKPINESEDENAG